MQISKFLSLITFSIFLIASVSAATGLWTSWEDGTASRTINYGESAEFDIYASCANPPLSISVKLYNANSNLIYIFQDKIIQDSVGVGYVVINPVYQVDQSIYGTSGEFKIEIEYSDKMGNYPKKILNLKVNPVQPPQNHAPVITSSPVIKVNEKQHYSYDVDAEDEDGDSLTYSLESAPSWLSINSNTGLIEGTAPEVSEDKTFNVKVKVSDGEDFDTQEYTLKVKDTYCPPENHAPVITSTPVTQVNENQYYAYDVEAQDADGDSLTYYLLQKPNWLSINLNTGLISGVAQNVYSDTDISIKVKVSDGKDYDVQSYTLTVKNVPCPPQNHAPVLNFIPNQNIDEGDSYSYQVMATDADNDALAYSLIQTPSTPAWLSINSQTGLITGIAPSVNSNTNFNVKVKVLDEHGAYDTQTYTLTVKDVSQPPVNNPPTLNSIPNQNIDEGDSYSYQVTATDPENDDLTYSINGAPQGFTISTNGLISGTAPGVSSDTDFQIEVQVSDGINPTVTQTYTLTVKDISGGKKHKNTVSELRVIPEDELNKNEYFDQYVPKTIHLQAAEDEEEQLSWLQRLIKAISDFFNRTF